jgi:hypothetical protein
VILTGLLRMFFRWRWHRRAPTHDYVNSHAKGPYYHSKYDRTDED